MIFFEVYCAYGVFLVGLFYDSYCFFGYLFFGSVEVLAYLRCGVGGFVFGVKLFESLGLF